MLLRVFFLYILIGHLFEVCVFSFECLPEECLKCSVTGVTGLCTNCSTDCASVTTLSDHCKPRDFTVSINATGSEVEEAERVSLTCVHDLPDQLNVTYEWYKDNEPVGGQEKEYTIEKTFSQHVGQYHCVVRNQCGSYTSAPHDVTIHNTIIILVICGCGALSLIIIMGVCMKIKMYRDKVKNQQRTKERLQEMRRAQDLQNCAVPSNPRLT